MRLHVAGLDETLRKMRAYPRQLRNGIRAALEAALLVIWGHIPSYPPPPRGSSYVRTGQLGRSLGSDQGGGKAGGSPDIYEVKSMGASGYVARFGTNLEYAPLVIGDSTTEQSSNMQYWWTLPQTVVALAREGVRRVFVTLKEEMIRFMEEKA